MQQYRPHRIRVSRQGLLSMPAWLVSLIIFAASAVAELPDWDAAVRPLDEGVPQVAVMRLREILKRELAPADKKAVLTKLGEALLAAQEPEEALKILEDPLLQDVPVTTFWRAKLWRPYDAGRKRSLFIKQSPRKTLCHYASAAVLRQAEALTAARALMKRCTVCHPAGRPSMDRPRPAALDRVASGETR